MSPQNVDSFSGLFRALELDRPLEAGSKEDQAVYVANLHKSSGVNPVDELRGNIEESELPATWLFTGHRGVGKSTELRRMAHELRQKGHFVVVADMGEYFSLSEPISTELLLLAVAAAAADGAEFYLGGNRTHEGYATRLWHWLSTTDVTLKGLEAQLPLGDGKMSFKAELKDNASFRSQVLKSVAAAPARLHTQAKAFLKELAEDVAKHERYGPGKKAVLILDSLERLRVSGSTALACYEGIQRTFDTNADMLKLGAMHVVYSVPPFLPFLTLKIGSYFGVEVASLPHAKVFKRPGPLDAGKPVEPNPEGIALVVATVRKRVPSIESLIPLPVLERLALSSSGSIRDFFRLVRSVASKARTVGASTPIRDITLVDIAEDRLRNEMRVSREDRQWMREVRRTQGDGLESMANLPRLAQLFDAGVILGYSNGNDWCDVHHVLHEQLRATEASDSRD